MTTSPASGHRHLLRRLGGLLADVVMGLMVVAAVPLVVLVVGTPIVLLVRLFIEVARRL
jgi:hypothetical protein